jgi:hypothetical protein
MMAARQEPGVAAHRGPHLLSPVGGRVGAEDEREEPAGLFQARPDLACLTGRVQAGRIADRDPADRDPGLRGQHAADVDRAPQGHTAGPAHLRAVEDHGAGGDEHLILDPAAGQVRVRAGQHVIPDHQGMTCGAAQHGLLHDHAVGAHVHRATVGGQHRAMQHAASRPDPDLTAEHRRGRHVRIRVHGRMHVTMPYLHEPTVHHRRVRGARRGTARADRSPPARRPRCRR